MVHAPWRDEILHWSIVLESDSLKDLLFNLRYEGHPALWHFLLYPLTRITTDPVAMQLLNGTIALCAVYVLVRHAPFSLWQRVALAFGYVFFVEFALVSRAYMLGALLLLLCLVLYHRYRHTRPVPFALLTGLLANTSIFGLILAGILWILFLYELWETRCSAWWRRPHPGQYALAILLAAALSLFSIATIIPASDYGSIVNYSSGFNVLQAGKQVKHAADAFIAIPAFWQSDWWDNLAVSPSGVVHIVTSCIFLILAFASLSRTHRFYLLFAIGFLLIYAVMYAIGIRAIRYYSHYFLLWLSMAWLYAARKRLFPGGHASRTHSRLTLIFSLFCILQLAGGLAAFALHAAVPFSQARAAGRWIHTNGLNNLPAFGAYDYSVLPMTAWTGKPVWVPENRKFLMHGVWDSSRVHKPPRHQAIRACVEAFKTHPSPEGLLIFSWMTYADWTGPAPFRNTEDPFIEDFLHTSGLRLFHKKAFTNHTAVPSSRYILYHVGKTNRLPAAP